MPRLRGKKGNKLERYYQIFLETRLGGSHAKLDCGTTDITAKDMHVEIKNWKTWKHALGQLDAYRARMWRPKAYAVFFGKISDKSKKIAIEIFASKGIGVYEFVSEANDELRALCEAVDMMEVDDDD